MDKPLIIMEATPEDDYGQKIWNLMLIDQSPKYINAFQIKYYAKVNAVLLNVPKISQNHGEQTL